MEIPVYLFTGFLEAGKTKFIQETLENPDFDTGENTLVIVCEEGLEEFEKEKFKVRNVTFEYIDELSNVDGKNFAKIAKAHKAKRVIVEYNGMWPLDNLYKAFPKDWSVYQEIFTADASTFKIYNQNMRNLVFDKLTSCELVMFNRVDIMTDKEELHKIVRAVTPRANIAYEYTDGHVEEDDIEDPLPFDIDAEIIEIADNDYALWYRDMSENPSKYVGKILKFKGIVGRDAMLGDKACIFGRHVMTCCEDDIQFSGLVCKSKEVLSLKSRDWAIITSKLVIGEHKVYRGEGPILIAQTIEMAEKPEQEVATFM
jgi:hypothetical protein